MSVFAEIDIDQGGTIDQEEIYDALQEAGVEISEEGVETLFNMIDEDGSGEIDQDEWKEAVNFYLELKEEEKEMARQKKDNANVQKSLRAMKLAQLGLSTKAMKEKKSKMKGVMGFLSPSSSNVFNTDNNSPKAKQLLSERGSFPSSQAKSIRFEDEQTVAKTKGNEMERSDILRSSVNSSSNDSNEPISF